MTTREIAERLAAIVERHYGTPVPDRRGLVDALEGGLVPILIDVRANSIENGCGDPECVVCGDDPNPLAGENPGQRAAAPAADESRAAQECRAIWPGPLGFLCSLPLGHKGEHVAGSAALGLGVEYARWSQEAPNVS